MDINIKEKESVWDYPRPPEIEPFCGLAEVICNGLKIAKSKRVLRVLETSHPPVYYFPPEDVMTDCLFKRVRDTYCRYKGCAKFYDIVVKGKKVEYGAFSFPDPWTGYEDLAGYLVFYAHKMDLCSVDGEIVVAQPGELFGGWITANIMGPYKGLPGTDNW